LYPEAADIASSLFSEEDGLKVVQQLGHLGFTDPQARDAVSFLSQSSPLASNLLGSLPSLEAAIEYLVLNVPECDLPQRFLPSINSSNPFITSAYSGTDDLKRRWIEDKAVKEAGWPAHVVKDCTVNSNLLAWDRLLAELGKRLIGKDSFVEVANSDPYIINTDEVEALGASFVDPTQLVIPLFSAPIQIHILVSSIEYYPRSSYAPMYITSTTAPPYIRLHLLSRILIAMKSNSFMEPDEGFCMAVMRCLEGEWAIIEDNGPPSMSMVLKHFVPSPQASPEINANDNLAFSNERTTGRHRGRLRLDDRDSNQIRHDFEALCRSDKVCLQLF
jgi:ATP-dependent RNA helicase DHX57